MGHRLTAQEWRHTASLSHTQMCHVLLCPLTVNGATLLCPLTDDDPMLFPQKTPCCSVLSCSLCYWTGVDIRGWRHAALSSHVLCAMGQGWTSQRMAPCCSVLSCYVCYGSGMDITEDGAMLLCPLMCCVIWDRGGHHRGWRHAALSFHVLCAMRQGWTLQKMAPCCCAMLLCPLMCCVLWDRGGHYRGWRHAALSSHVMCAMGQGWTLQKTAPCCSVLSCAVCYGTGVDITEDGAMLLCPLMCCVLWDRGGHHREWRPAALSSHALCAMGQGWTLQKMVPCCSVLSCIVCYETGMDITEDGAVLLCPVMLCVLWVRDGHYRRWCHAVLSSHVMCAMRQGWTSQRMAPCCSVLSCYVCYGSGMDIIEDGAMLLCPLMCCVIWDRGGHHRGWRHAVLSSHVMCAMGQGWTLQKMAPCCSVLSCAVCYGTGVDITEDGAMLLCPLMLCVLWDRGGHYRRRRHAALSSHVLCAMGQGWTLQRMAPCCSVLSCAVCYVTGGTSQRMAPCCSVL